MAGAVFQRRKEVALDGFVEGKMRFRNGPDVERHNGTLSRQWGDRRGHHS